MSNKIVKINMQLERLEQQKKELLEKKRKEEAEKLTEIGRIVAKYTKIEDADTELLKEAMERYYIPAQKEKEAKKEKDITELKADIGFLPERDTEDA